jgi:DNA-directed RNA polymerase specialized sigma24 family protein
MEWVILNLGHANVEKYRESKRILVGLAQQKTELINTLRLSKHKLTDAIEIDLLDKELSKLEDDKKHINSMISDCQYVVDFLNRRYEPEARRSMNRRSMEQRTDVWEPSWFDSYISPNSWTVERELPSGDKFLIEDALSTLSKRERQCYTLHHAMGFSYRQIASELLLKKGTVQYYIEEATKKIEDSKLNSLFLISG